MTRQLLKVAALAAAITSNSVQAADAAHPVVVELYQSQGCSSCPPADVLVNELASRPDVLALSFAVTYWDQLGWKDIFAKPEFTARQWDYARAGRRSSVATPQTVINGRTAVNGADGARLSAALRDADRGTSGPAITVLPDGVLVGAGPATRAAIVWLVRYDPRTLNVPIRAGENGGRTIPHRNIVRSLQQIGQWRGQAMRLAVARDPRLAGALLVQQGPGGPIIAARKI